VPTWKYRRVGGAAEDPVPTREYAQSRRSRGHWVPTLM
jgi:hypothetical protein